MPWDRLNFDAEAFQFGCVLPANTWERLERSAESRESANTPGAGAFRARLPVCAEALTFGRSFWAGAFRVLSSLWDRVFNQTMPSDLHRLPSFQPNLKRRCGDTAGSGEPRGAFSGFRSGLGARALWFECHPRRAGHLVENAFQFGFFLSPERREATGSVSAIIEHV
jgi:hypothetical protein